MKSEKTSLDNEATFVYIEDGGMMHEDGTTKTKTEYDAQLQRLMNDYGFSQEKALSIMNSLNIKKGK